MSPIRRLSGCCSDFMIVAATKQCVAPSSSGISLQALARSTSGSQSRQSSSTSRAVAQIADSAASPAQQSGQWAHLRHPVEARRRVVDGLGQRGSHVRAAEGDDVPDLAHPAVLELGGLIAGAAGNQAAHRVADHRDLVDLDRPFRHQLLKQLGQRPPILGDMATGVVTNVHGGEAQIPGQPGSVRPAVLGRPPAPGKLRSHQPVDEDDDFPGRLREGSGEVGAAAGHDLPSTRTDIGSWSTLRLRSSSSPIKPSITAITPPPSGLGDSDRCGRWPLTSAFPAARPTDVAQRPIPLYTALEMASCITRGIPRPTWLNTRVAIAPWKSPIPSTPRASSSKVRLVMARSSSPSAKSPSVRSGWYSSSPRVPSAASRSLLSVHATGAA